MQDKYKMNAKELESINNDLFNSFDPEQELWIIGGSANYTNTATATYSAGNPDMSAEIDYPW
jgi:hypothetical protein